MKGVSAETGAFRSRYGAGAKRASTLLKRARYAMGSSRRKADFEAMRKNAQAVVDMAKASKSQVARAATLLATAQRFLRNGG